MSKEVESYSLPISSVDLCFDGNAFVQPYFSADRFLQEQRGRASLETMRDDLGSYLKVLRSATLDLIDHDYADFVGLSSSLVGLDKAVGKIRDPLGQLREEVMAVKSSLEEALRGVKLQLEERRSLRVKRSMLEASLQALKSLQLLESLLSEEYTCASWRGSCVEDEKSHELAVAERSGAGCNQLQFCLEKCDPVDQLKLRASSARSKLMQLLEAMLLALLAGRDVGSTSGNSALVRLLRLYASLNETAVAEDLVGEHVVAPALDTIMRKPSLAEGGGRHGQLLSEIYRQALSVVAEKLGRLLALTSSSEERHLSVDGFDFLANSFWPQFVHQLEVNLPNIYAPGNPDVFHQRYCETMLFLEELEKFSGSETAVKRLRSKPSYQHFLRSWNLKVYFQIRFQELAGFVESAFPAQPYPSRGFDGSTAGSLLGLSTSRPCHGGFWLAPTNTCWECIDRCWHGNTFIGRVGHMFWKMSLQFVARYSLWSRDILEHQLRSVQPEDVRPSTVGSGEVVVEEQSVSEQSGDGVPMPGPLLLLPLCLHRDVCQLSERLERHLLPRATSALTAAATNTTTSCHQHQAIDSLLKRSLDDGLQALRSNVEPLALRCVVDIIARWSLPHLRQCRDIPRLYRRTNRVHPTRPRPYVSSALAPALHFRSLVLASFSSPPPNNKAQPLHDTTPWVDAALLTHIMVLIFSEITLQYHSGVLEVLTSVHKMEESLRRLKRIRAAPSDGEAPSSAADDDEKIRAQLALDVHHFCRQIECAGVQRNEVKQLLELVELVDNATSRVNARSQ